MTRKDSEKETDRPHYYSQFWLDVAAGRKIIGASREDEAAEPEPQEVAPRKSARSASATIEHEEPAYNEVETPAAEEEVYDETETYEPEPEADFLGGEEEFDQELPNLIVDEEAEIPDVEPLVEPLEEEEDEGFFDEEEEDEDMEWGRGRKKPKPGRQTKQPSKKPRRDRDRRF